MANGITIVHPAPLMRIWLKDIITIYLHYASGSFDYALSFFLCLGRISIM